MNIHPAKTVLNSASKSPLHSGRIIYDNLKKTIAYTLTHTLPEIWPIFLNLALSFPLGKQGPLSTLGFSLLHLYSLASRPREGLTGRLIDSESGFSHALLRSGWPPHSHN